MTSARVQILAAFCVAALLPRIATALPFRATSAVARASSAARPEISSACGDGTTLCLNNSRFTVRVTFTTQQGQSGSGQAVPITADTGYFWFFDINNVELVIKVVDGRAVNQRFWVFAGGLTNVNVVMTVTDTQTGSVSGPCACPHPPAGSSPRPA